MGISFKLSVVDQKSFVTVIQQIIKFENHLTKAILHEVSAYEFRIDSANTHPILKGSELFFVRIRQQIPRFYGLFILISTLLSVSAVTKGSNPLLFLPK